jgi:glycosyltransferase involved in cell wall biosynthesis
MKKKLLFVTSLYSPFQVDLLKSFDQSNNLSFHIAFTENYSNIRGKHWQDGANHDNSYIHLIDKNEDYECKLIWTKRIIEDIKPTHVVLGGWRLRFYKDVFKFAKSKNIKVGFWFEPPNYTLNKITQYMLYLYARIVVSNADFIFSIGDRSETYYKGIVKNPQNVYLLTYGQNLNDFRKIPDKFFLDSITFLFSGQLVNRHNIRWICNAIECIYDKYGSVFRVVIAAKGPEQHFIDSILAKRPELINIISYDRDYNKWSDRVNPFSDSQVLLYPTSHSGWGLVIPEAMAAGMVVLSTRKSEAARYFIRHGINGRFIDESYSGLVDGMMYCLENRDDLVRLSKQARIDSVYGEDGYVSNMLKSFLSKPHF